MVRNHPVCVTTILLVISVSVCRTVEGDDQPLLSEMARNLAQFWDEIDQKSYSMKQDSTENQRDPVLRYINLGKRKNDKPKYNPGWKFIGLGKKRSQPDDGPPVRGDPYLSILALSNLNAFFQDLREEMKTMNKGKVELSELIKNLKIPDMYVRGARKQNGIFRKGSHPIYDPSWEMTGLGKK